MTPTAGIFVIVLSVFALPACGKSGPCSGGGMEPDKRDLPMDWAAVLAPPDGAVACHLADGSTDEDYGRSYEVGGNPEEGAEKWRAQLMAQGFATKPVADDTFIVIEGTHPDGATVRVQVSKKVTDKGWSSVYFQPAKK